MERIYVGCDNAAIELKEELIAFLHSKGVAVTDMGCNQKDDLTLYPEIAKRVCDKVVNSSFEEKGLLVCGTGIGMAMCANKVHGIRAAVCHDIFSTERSVLSNNSNVICMGERVIGKELAKVLLGRWIELEYRDGPSTPKVEAMMRIETET